MIRVELTDIITESKKKELFSEFGERGKRWVAWVALSLKDMNAEREVAEWFYIVACSPAYVKKPLKGSAKYEPKYFVIQNEFDIQEIRDVAKERIGKVRAESWDEFYDKMSQFFYHED